MFLRIIRELNKYKNPSKIKVYKWFFKTGKGQYGEGDEFLGLASQQVKDVAQKFFSQIDLDIVEKLLNSKIHEHRMTAVRMLVLKYQKGNLKTKENIYKFYLKNSAKINNWDLVDVSADKIIGDYLLAKNRNILDKLAKSKNLWQRRIAIISTFEFIRNNQFRDTLRISQILLCDQHDLIHKACGWMLREVGKRDVTVLIKFLNKNIKKMPRTMLRYAIEKFPKKERKYYLAK